ncbi:MAG: branched-chain amino acid ABC transporter permease [Rhodospirillales bacterium]|nr:branched-chain amino acid ABC transporter permease [Rhodospirillales bacterium]
MLGGIYMLIAVAFTLAIGVLNFLNFSIPGIFMVGAIATWRALENGWPWVGAIAAGLLAAGVASYLVERFTYRWMRGLDHEIPLVSSLGFLILFENLVLIGYGSDQQTFPALMPDFNIRVAGLVIGTGQLISLVLALVLVIAASGLLERTRIGRGIRAVAENADTATILGVEIHRVVPALFILIGLLSGVSGILFAMNYLQVSAFMGHEIGLKGIAAMVIGGMGNIWGAILGGLLIGLIEVLSIAFFGANRADICVYGALLLLLVVRPEGLLGGSAIVREKL